MNPIAKARGLPLAATSPRLHHRDLTDPKIDVWLHDVSPDTQPKGCASRRCEQSCSTQTFLPDAGFSIRTGKRSVGKVRAPKPLSGALWGAASLSAAALRQHSCRASFLPMAKARGIQRPDL